MTSGKKLGVRRFHTSSQQSGVSGTQKLSGKLRTHSLRRSKGYASQTKKLRRWRAFTRSAQLRYNTKTGRTFAKSLRSFHQEQRQKRRRERNDEKQWQTDFRRLARKLPNSFRRFARNSRHKSKTATRQLQTSGYNAWRRTSSKLNKSKRKTLRSASNRRTSARTRYARTRNRN